MQLLGLFLFILTIYIEPNVKLCYSYSKINISMNLLKDAST